MTRSPYDSPSLMPRPIRGTRRTDHPAPEGLPPPEVKVVTAWRVACDGGGGALGHPRVYYTIPREQGFVDCGYCDARFLHADSARTTDTPATQDHAQPADVRGDVGGKQPGPGSDGAIAGTDGASGRREGGL